MTCPVNPHTNDIYSMNLYYENAKVDGRKVDVYMCSECGSLADEDGNYVEAGSVK
ncbi:MULTISPECIES: hypothetical protein [Rhodococcus erythropolis group]|uniref:hypothetical protein n=1 Tax=Rhodococcus erythropolis group TaxID=2840174 RepID=UPI000AE96991|nr:MULTISPECIES: hypothetical protein [Rhodococcus erythropolis group]MCZ4546620.1 hypothetical protein [Rhodococcus qingshengii]